MIKIVISDYYSGRHDDSQTEMLQIEPSPTRSESIDARQLRYRSEQ